MPEWTEDDELPYIGQGGSHHADPPLRGLGVKRAMAGGVAGVALLMGPVGIAKLAVPTGDDADVETAEDSQTLFASVNRSSPVAADSQTNEDLAVQDVTAEDKPGAATAAVTTTTSTTTTTTAPPAADAPPDDGDDGGGDEGDHDPDTGAGLGDPGDYATWDALANCESGGNWQTNTGNGYYGGIQFSLSTWQAVGGSGYPHENSREEQIHRGQILQAQSGWGQWPHCTSQLGYR